MCSQSERHLSERRVSQSNLSSRLISPMLRSDCCKLQSAIMRHIGNSSSWYRLSDLESEDGLFQEEEVLEVNTIAWEQRNVEYMEKQISQALGGRASPMVSPFMAS